MNRNHMQLPAGNTRRRLRAWILAGGLISLVLVVAVWVGFKIYFTRLVETEITRTVAEVPELARIEYGHMSLMPLPMRFEMRDVAIYLTGQSIPIEIERLRVPHLILADPVPTALTAHITGLRLSQTHLPDSDLQQLWQVLGYRSVSLDIDLTYTYDATQKAISVERMHVSGEGLGDLEVALRMRQVDLPGMVAQADNSLYWKLALPAVALESLRLTYQDASLARRLGALENGRLVFQGLQTYLHSIQQKTAARSDSLLSRNLQAVLAFLEQPDSLRVEARPAEPTSLLKLLIAGRDPGQIMQLLNLSIQE